jgi:hypothetical protein
MIKKLRKLVKYNKEKIPYLSDGGCGRFALHLYKHLVQIGIDVKIVSVDNRKIKKVRELIAEFFVIPKREALFDTSFGHVLLYVKIDGKRYFIDGYHIYEDIPDEWFDHYNYGIITYQQLSISVAYGWWNKRYDVRNDRNIIEAIKLFVK